MKLRKLRIAWSAIWALAAVLLIALWVRSYWWLDNLSFPAAGTAFVGSAEGKIVVFSSPEKDPQAGDSRWELKKFPMNTIPTRARISTPTWSFVSNRFNTEVTFPHWFLATLCAILAPASCLPWRFTVRTLLIATTLVALALGLIVWTLHR